MRNLARLFLFLPLLATAGTVHVTWNFEDFVAAPIAVKRVKITPLAPYGTNGSGIITGDWLPKQTSGVGALTVSNMVNGYSYRVELTGSYTNTIFTNSFSGSVTGAVNGKDYISSSIIVSGNLVAYSQAAANAKFLTITNSAMTGTPTLNGTNLTTLFGSGTGTGTVFLYTNAGPSLQTNLSGTVTANTNNPASFTNSTLAAAQAGDTATYTQTVADNAALSNIVVSFTITTNLSYTNYLLSINASNNSFNGLWKWSGSAFTNQTSLRWISNTAAGVVMMAPALPNAFTNDAYTGQFKTNANQSTPPYVFYPSNAVITTNWFIAGQSQKIPLTSIDVEDFGARGDAVKLYSATVSAGNLICTNSAFTANDVGKSAVVYTTSTNTDYVLARIVAFNNATNVLLSTNFTQSTPYEAWYFTDNSAANKNALNSFTGDGVLNYTGQYGTLYGFATSAYDSFSTHYAVINLPTDRSTGLLTNTSRTIVLRGQTPPMIYPSFINAGGTTTLGAPNTGTIFYNFSKPVSGVTNDFVLHDGIGVGGSQFGRERYLIENLTLRQPGRPTHHAMWLARAGTMYLRNFAIDVDQTTNWLNASSGEPPFYMQGIVSNANTVYGIYGPDPYNYAGVTMENVTVSYHGTAYRMGEHTVGIGKVIGVGCGALYYMDGAFGSQGTYNGSTIDFLYAYLCQYRIVVSTNSTAREPLIVGNFVAEEGFPRADIGPMVYDPWKRGDINIQAITGNAQNTTIESTNGCWNDAILNYSYNRGVIISNSAVRATSFTGSGSGLTGIPASTNALQLGGNPAANFLTNKHSGTVTLNAGLNLTNGFGSLSWGPNGDFVALYGLVPNTLTIGNNSGVGLSISNNGALTGNGSGLTALNASQLTSGTVAVARYANTNNITDQTTFRLVVYLGTNAIITNVIPNSALTGASGTNMMFTTATNSGATIFVTNINSLGVAAVFQGKTTNAGPLLFNPDNTHDIGASGAGRPKDIRAAGTVYAATSLYADSVFGHRTGSGFYGGTDGWLRMQNNAGTTFNGLSWGLLTAPFPGVVRTNASLMIVGSDGVGTISNGVAAASLVLRPYSSGPAFWQAPVNVTNVGFFWSSNSSPPSIFWSYFDGSSNRVDSLK